MVISTNVCYLGFCMGSYFLWKKSMVAMSTILYKICIPNWYLCKNDCEKKDSLAVSSDHMNFEFLLPKYSVHTKLQINFQKIRTCFKCYKCTGYNRFLYRGELTDKFQPNRFLFVGFYCSFLIQLYLFHVFIWKKNNRITLLLFLYNLLQNYIKSCTAILR